MSLLNGLRTFGGNLLDFAQRLGEQQYNPIGNPDLESAAGEIAPLLRQRYQQQFKAARAQAVRRGAPFYAMNDIAAAQAQPAYDEDLARTVQNVQALRAQRQTDERLQALRDHIANNPKLNDAQKSLVGALDPADQAKVLAQLELPKDKQFQFLTVGDGILAKVNPEDGSHEFLRVPGAGGGGGGGDPLAAGMDSEDLDNAATAIMGNPKIRTQYVLSRGKDGQRQLNLINHRITEKLHEAGMNMGDLMAWQARAEAQRASVKDLVGMNNSVSAFEKVAQFNGQRLLELIDGIDDTHVPVIEGYTRAFKRGKGDIDPQEFRTVLLQYQTEVARILNSPNGKGVISDSAREDLMNAVPENMSAGQAKRLITRIQLEMDMRRSSLNDQISDASSQTGFGAVPPATTSVAPPAVSNKSAKDRFAEMFPGG
jgi:hypothetical protein